MSVISNNESKSVSNKDKIHNPDEIKKENVEKLPERKEMKKNIEDDKNKNKKTVDQSKPKFIIKIPKPFALGYFIIDIGALLKSLLGKLFALLSALVLGLIMAKLGDLLGDLLDKLFDSKGSVDSNDVNEQLKSIDVISVVRESIDEENMMNLNSLNSASGSTITGTTDGVIVFPTESQIDSSGTYGIDSVPIDVVDNTPKDNKINKKNSQKDAYTINKRNRKDLLESDEVSNRLNSEGVRKGRSIYNPNYGEYS